MAIFNRIGDAVTVLRFATLEDVRTVDKRKPDKQDEEAIKCGSYVIVREPGGSNGFRERLYHQAYLRADGGSREITDALERHPAVPDAEESGRV
jgi:hypothetical protein